MLLEKSAVIQDKPVNVSHCMAHAMAQEVQQVHAGDSLIWLSAEVKAAALASCMAVANKVRACSPLGEPKKQCFKVYTTTGYIAQWRDGQSPWTNAQQQYKTHVMLIDGLA